MTGQVILLSELAITAVGTDTWGTDTQELVALAVREHSHFVFKIAYSLLRNHHDAEDATQETFLRLLKHRHEFAAVEDQRAWLARVVWRIAIDKTRKLPQPSLDDAANSALLDQLRAADSGSEEIAINEQMLTLLQSLITGLPPDLRDVIILSTVDEMTSSAIAAVLDIPETSVRTRQFRARQMLKEKFAAVLNRTKESAV